MLKVTHRGQITITHLQVTSKSHFTKLN